ncbi:hypothetical protein KY335_04090 [Candidatus Woesearchaeota archaeon]|nr:hypothetical protein [Candidatus Woesearchaeota archaeon]
MAVFEDAIRTLESLGALDVLLPFMLMFVVLFAALQKTEILGKGNEGRKYNIVVALVIALLIVVPHVVYGTADRMDGKLGGALFGMPDVVEIINNALPSISIWIVGILMVMLLVGIFAPPEWREFPYQKWILWVAVIVVGYIFGNAAGFFKDLPGPLRLVNTPENQAALLIILIFGIIIYLVVREPEGDAKAQQRKQKREEQWKAFWGRQ